MKRISISFLSKIEISPQRRQGRRELIFYLAVRGRQIKSSLSRQYTDLLQSHSHQLQPKSIPEGMSFVIRSPLTVGSQREISLCDLCAFAVNLVLKEPPIHPKGQWNQSHSETILSNLDTNVSMYLIRHYSYSFVNIRHLCKKKTGLFRTPKMPKQAQQHYPPFMLFYPIIRSKLLRGLKSRFSAIFLVIPIVFSATANLWYLLGSSTRRKITRTSSGLASIASL